MDGKFQVGLFDKRRLISFSIFRIPDKSSNIPSNIVYPPVGAHSLGIGIASNNPDSMSTTIKPLITRMSRQGVSIEKINSVVLKFFSGRF